MDYGIPSQSGLTYNLPSGWLEQAVSIGSVVLIVAAIILAVVFILRLVFRSSRFFPAVFQKKIFLLTVPKTADEHEEKSKSIKEVFSGVENLYANLGGIKAQKGMKAWLFGRNDDWTLEIVADGEGMINFYLAAPAHLEEYIQQQFLSVYPHCQIEPIEDYNIFSARGIVAAGYLKLAKRAMFPIKTYKNMDADPMIALLSVLAELPAGMTAAAQFTMRSARKEWRRYGLKVAKAMQQGKNLEKAMKANSGGGVLGVLSRSADILSSGEKDDKQNLAPTVNYRLSPSEEQTLKLIEEKAGKAGLDVNVRLVAFAPFEEQAKGILRQLANSFSQYSNYETANSFKAVIKGIGNKFIHDFIYRRYDNKIRMVLNTEEIVSLWHLPLPGTEIANIRWLQAKRLAPPVTMPKEGLILGENSYRGENALVRIKDKDRQRHVYIIGMTGTGKSWLMANLAINDIKNGKGVCVVDPHGSLIEDILPHIPEERVKDTIYFDPSDMERPMGLNMLEANSPSERDFAAQEMINIFYKLLPDPAMGGPMFEHYMRNALLALMADQENPGTLVELPRIFTDSDFRRKKLEHVKDILVKDFWEREYAASQKGSTAADMLSYVISKTGRFVENEIMRNIIGQPKSGFNFREVMDSGKILLLNLSKGRIGETNSALLGLIAVSKLQMAALARADMPENQRRDFYLYIDEFQNFITDSISIILAEARKYKLDLTIGHQYIAQLTQGNDTKVRDAVFGNVGTIISFRVGVNDAELIAKQLAPRVNEHDVMNIEKFNAYVRLLIDNTASETFNMHCFPLPGEGNADLADSVKQLSRTKYGKERSLVISEIIQRSKIGELGRKPEPES